MIPLTSCGQSGSALLLLTCAFYGRRSLSYWLPSMAPMWHPTFAITRGFHGYVLLAPQSVYQDWLTACRSSAPLSSADTGTPHSRFAAFSLCSGRQTVHSSRLSLAQGYHGHTRLCWSTFHFCCRCAVAVSSLYGFLLCGTLLGATHGGLPPVLSHYSCCQYALFRGSARRTVGLSPFVAQSCSSGSGTA